MHIKNEDIEQIKALDWIRFHHPNLADRAIHIANQRRTNYAYGNHLKRMGVKSGVPDLFFCKPSNGYHGLFIEIKTSKGRASEAQNIFIQKARDDGYFATICYSSQEVINNFCTYFNLPPGTIL